MSETYLSQYFSGVALKTLTAVEANPAASNQHEYNGNRDLVRLFGKATSKHRFRARFVYVSAQERITDEAPVTWYDARQNHPTRSEHRLYFPTTKVSRRASAGDLLIIGMLRDNSILIVIAKEGAPISNDLRQLFGVTTASTDDGFALWQKEEGLGEEETRSILQTIGILDRSAKVISSTGGRPAERTAVVVTSLPSDYAAVAGQLRDISEQMDELGTIFEVGRYDSPVGIWEIAIVQLGLGALYATNTVDQAVQRFLPEAVVLLGVARGVRAGMAAGDVVVVTAVYTADARHIELPQSEALASSHRVLQRALKEAAGTAWLERRTSAGSGGEPPRVIVAPITSASKLTSNPNEFLGSRAVAVDMGDAGLMDTLDRRSGVEVLVVRGIASVGGTERIDNTELASDNAAAFAMQVLSSLDVASKTEPSLGPISIPQAEQPYVTGFEIRSIRSIQAIEWSTPLTNTAGWHVLVGINGSGKTTALRCLALALLGKEDAQSLPQKWDTWLPEGTPNGGVTINLSIPIPEDTLTFSLSRNGPDDVEITSGHTPSGIFSVGYGPFRRFSGGDADIKERLTQRALRHMTLFSEEADLADSLAWLRSLYVKYLEDKANNTFCFEVEAFINNSDLLPSGTRLVDVSPDRITFEDGNKCVVSIEHLSDGYRSVLSLVLDILRHLSDHQSQVGLFSPERDRVVAEGIVLVDEIDVHLHPKWQQQIGSWFKTHFPKFQFVVASHSLFVCQSADSVFILPDPGLTGSGHMLTNVDLNQIKLGTVLDGYGTDVFGPGVDESDASKRLRRRLASLNLKQLRAGLTPDEKAEQTRLRAILPTSDVLPDPAVRG